MLLPAEAQMMPHTSTVIAPLPLPEDAWMMHSAKPGPV